MARFADLSNEVLLLISSFVQPPDIDNFYLTSKFIRKLNESRVAEHLDMKKQFQRIGPAPLWGLSDPNTGTWAKLLKDVLIAPRIASYVEHLDIQQWRTDWSDRGYSADVEQRRKDTLDESYQMLLKEAMQKPQYLSVYDCDEWIDHVHTGCEDQILGFLLTLLPNLSTLALSLNPDCHRGFERMLRCTSEDLNPKADIFSVLTRVIISAEAGSPKTPLQMIQCFAALPSMRHLYADNIITGGWYKAPRGWRSEITTLRLFLCDVESEVFFDFLTSFDSLVDFEYTHSKYLQSDHNNESYKPFWIVNALKYHAKHSLKKLTLRGHTRATHGDIMGSLCPFEVLEELHTDLEPMYDLSTEDDIKYARFSNMSLPEMLPTSIKKITLHMHEPEGEMHYSLVEDILPPKNKVLPHLEILDFRVACRDFQPILLRWRAALEAVGVRVTGI